MIKKTHRWNSFDLNYNYRSLIFYTSANYKSFITCHNATSGADDRKTCIKEKLIGAKAFYTIETQAESVFLEARIGRDNINR